MQLDQSAHRRKRAISLTPLIDVVFILLLFFMLSSNFMHWKQVDLSSPTSEPTDPDQKDIQVVTILNDGGELDFAGTAVHISNTEQLKAMIAEQPDAVYAIKVDSDVMTQSVITLLDELKAAGAKHVSLSGVMP